jgi:cyclophilin family peptidyl-prolyl cis-trans isomerase
MRSIFFTVLFFAILSCGNKDKVTITTEYGDMEIQLLSSTPKHKANFKKLVDEGFYNDLLFHRVMKGFMIQGGDPESRGASIEKPLGSGSPGYTIPAEIAVPHFKGMISAARQVDSVNPKKESSGSQFFLVHGGPVDDDQLDAIERAKNFKYSPEQREKYKKLGGAPILDGDYSVFGEVINGLDVIDKISEAPTDGRDRPLKDIKMKIQ